MRRNFALIHKADFDAEVAGCGKFTITRRQLQIISARLTE